MRLKLTNNLTKTDYEFEVVDKGNSTLFYNFEIILPQGIKDGEYSYKLFNEKEMEIATGLLQVGEYVPLKKEYKNKKQIIEYNG